eukprot:m.341106 g.341106  ORF g.341106 m.341106 type:complete len:51 (-) comp16108_c0_seq3:4066-4218(-)
MLRVATGGLILQLYKTQVGFRGKGAVYWSGGGRFTDWYSVQLMMVQMSRH